MDENGPCAEMMLVSPCLSAAAAFRNRGDKSGTTRGKNVADF